MASMASRAGRTLMATPFLAIAVICFTQMDLPKLEVYQKQVLETGKGVIEWPGGSLAVFDRFYRVDALDKMWRGASVVFSPSSQGFDPVSWWQMVSFLTDLGPVYCVWFMEAARGANAWTSAYSATFWVFAAQFFGIGTIAPIYYFLFLVSGPATADIAGSGFAKLDKRSFDWRHIAFLLPLVLGLHNFEVFAAYLSPDPITRHYWVWAWQMSPLWIGIASFAGSYVVGPRYYVTMLARPSVLIKAVCAVSAVVWVSVLLFSPHSPFEIFLPTWEAQDDLVLHTRRALQMDQVCLFGSSFLWLAYQLVEIYWLGFMEGDGFWPLALLPVVLACFGPGVTFALGWWWRERKLDLAVEPGRN
ncbi:hypothetical protein MFIFM68171_07341 [Madurella fahalii]|uniref:Uncharacterized protein n=1 Tax=Madurella fahalii TaxID=1157608 RepID=A0ABQ0GH98_9PEZI